MIKSHLTSEKQMADFLGYIIEDGLKDTKPDIEGLKAIKLGAVNIIR